MIIRWLVWFGWFFTVSVTASPNVVNVFIWADYIPQSVVHQFEHETGIHVNLSEYDGNEDLYAKLKSAPHSGYDVIVPSSYYVSRMRREGMLRTIDSSLLPNRHYLDPALLNQSFDPHNRYSYPYLWGTTGIAVDDRYWQPSSIHQWRDLWQPRFRRQLLLYDDFREVFAMGAFVLDYNINTQALPQIQAIYRRLLSILDNVRLFSGDVVISAYADSDVTVGMIESEDFVLAHSANQHLHYILPKDGFAIWQDCLAIPVFAPHYQNAMRFINFLMRPTVSRDISLSSGGSTPNLAARRLLPADYRFNPAMYPSKRVLDRGQFESDIGSSRQHYIHFWQLLKLSS